MFPVSCWFENCTSITGGLTVGSSRRLLRLERRAIIREMGAQFSEPTVKALFVHVYGFDVVWLARWRGCPQNRLPRDTDFSSLPGIVGLRAWDVVGSTMHTSLAVKRISLLASVLDASDRAASLAIHLAMEPANSRCI